ncbi:MAG: aminotransferase class I/II-fold pyridoxal phosphate-dependent enzyme [Methanomassiliicoccales archaeon]|nr:aminotransferase class I/II-fold pyridoxal phosphate-dependent enzyme [Methanomassiliicoccales archaeon]
MKATRRSMSVSYAIREFLVPAKKLENEGIEVIKLHIGDPNKYDFKTPKHVREALCKAVEECDNGYAESEGYMGLRKAIVDREKEKNQIDVEVNDVIVTAGVTEAIQMLVAAMIEPGDELLVPGPGYPTYPEFTSFFGGRPISYRTDESSNWQPDVDDIRKKITPRTKALVVINPNNPTGAVYPGKTLKDLADIAGEHDLLLISDEIYDLMTFDGVHNSPSTLAPDIPMVILNGFSKVDLLPGWRLGYAVFRDSHDELKDIKEGVMRQLRLRLSANYPCQMAMSVALKGPQDHHEEIRVKLRERAEFAFKRLNSIPGISTTKPRGAFYIFPRYQSKRWKDDREFVLDVLNYAHLLVVPGSGFGDEYGKGHFRLVFLPDIDTLGRAFDALADFMRDYS